MAGPTVDVYNTTAGNWTTTSTAWTNSTYTYTYAVQGLDGSFYNPDTHFVFEGQILDLAYQVDVGL